MPVKVDVAVKCQTKIEQKFPNTISFPDMGGLTPSDLNQQLQEKKGLLGGVFQSPSAGEDAAYEADCKVKDFKGEISLSDELVLTLDGTGTYKASDYAYGIVEDEGTAVLELMGDVGIIRDWPANPLYKDGVSSNPNEVWIPHDAMMIRIFSNINEYDIFA